MNTTTAANDRYARTIEASKRIRWDIDRDVIRGRNFDFTRKFLPDGISKLERLGFLGADDRRMLGQIQGRTYANMFGLVERFIGAKMLDISRDHWLGDQKAMEALVRFTDEELKHQELFRRIERMVAEGMPAGYQFLPNPNDVAGLVLGKSTWSVLALTTHIELFVLAHYRQSIDPDGELSELFKDVFLYHWKEESQHAILDEMEWQREDAKLSPEQRDQAVTDLIELVGAVDGMLQVQAKADADYFFKVCRGPYSQAQSAQVREGVLYAYRWQYIISGVEEPRFQKILGGLISQEQFGRIGAALAPIMATKH
jgi:DNA-binding Lrp family transcriptional regulator